jgi:hypothetical protein
VIDLRFDDGSTAQQTIGPLEPNLLVATDGKGWAAATVEQIGHG